MLTGMRNAAGTWLGRAVLIVFFGLIIISFAVFGIGDIFRGYGGQTVATVGGTEISTESLRRAYQDELQRIQRQSRRAITNDEARAFGLDRIVLNRLIGEAALDADTKRMGLGVDPNQVARDLLQEPAFRGTDGQFNRAAFSDYLREVGLSEAQFIEEQRRATLRRQLIETIGVMPVPDVVLAAIHRYRSEERTVRLVTVPAVADDAVPAPDDATLTRFFEERRALFRAPEYRKAIALAIQRSDFASDLNISDADLQAAYAAGLQAGRFGTPERRQVQQLVFANETDARAALARVKAGVPLEALAADMRLSMGDIDLGLKSRADLIDKAVADAAFQLPVGVVSDVVNGQFGSVLLRVTAIEPARAAPFEQVAEALRAEVRTQRIANDPIVRDRLNALHDKIEEQRASGKPLTDIAKELDLPLITLDGLDNQGQDRNGMAVDGVPEAAGVIRAIFASDIGVDNEAVRGRDGTYVWFEVVSIDRARDKSFDEVKADVERRWREDEVQRRTTARAGELLQKLVAGSTLETIATETGGTVETVTGLTRSGTHPVGSSAQSTAFAVPEGTFATATAANSRDRLLLQVTASTTPPFDPSSESSRALRRQVENLQQEDLTAQYLARVQSELGTSVNQRLVGLATGGAER
jgi:peptidyl-prolyl cis-trans isomerase D